MSESRIDLSESDGKEEKAPAYSSNGDVVYTNDTVVYTFNIVVYTNPLLPEVLIPEFYGFHHAVSGNYPYLYPD